MNSGHGMRRHRRRPDLLNWLIPRFSPTASGFGGGDTNTSLLSSSGGNPTTTSSPASTPPPVSTPPATTLSSSSSSTSSTSSTSSSSSSTSLSTSSTTSSSIISPSTSSTPPPHTTPTGINTPVNTHTYYSVPSFSNSVTATGASNSSSSSAAPSSGVSTGILIGGIAAGILGVAGIALAIMYFIRRWNRDSEDSHFDADVFKRQSVMLQADEFRSSSRGHGGSTPRPPTMIQRHIDNATPVPSMGAQHGYPHQQGDYNVRYNNPGYNSPGFHPGQVVTVPNPFYSPYGESPMSPSAMAAPYDSAYSPHARVDLARQPSQATYLSRQPPFQGPPSPTGNNVGDAHYVNLSRSSVTPFQAAQYEEISRRLDVVTPVPEAVVQGDSRQLSPFADPITEEEKETRPPSPARVSSKPPSLPELSASVISPVAEFNPAANPSSPLTKPADIPATPVPAYIPSSGKRPDTVYTLYDDDDAYGGI